MSGKFKTFTRMKNKFLMGLIGAASLALLSGCVQPAPAAAAVQTSDPPVAQLSDDNVIVAYVNNSQAPFDLSANEVLYLKDLGISSPVVTAMINHDTALRGQAA